MNSQLLLSQKLIDSKSIKKSKSKEKPSNNPKKDPSKFLSKTVQLKSSINQLLLFFFDRKAIPENPQSPIPTESHVLSPDPEKKLKIQVPIENHLSPKFLEENQSNPIPELKTVQNPKHPWKTNPKSHCVQIQWKDSTSGTLLLNQNLAGGTVNIIRIKFPTSFIDLVICSKLLHGCFYWSNRQKYYA